VLAKSSVLVLAWPCFFYIYRLQGCMRGMYCMLLCRWALMPCAEESSWLSVEGSKVSLAAGAGALEQERSGYGQRRAAIPAANRAMLDRQVRKASTGKVYTHCPDEWHASCSCG
jgi:hypothetical protein